MSVTAIANRYAKSLLDLSVEQNKLEQVYGDMLGFKEALKSRDLVMLLKSPIVSMDKKKAVFNAAFADKADKLSLSFFDLVISKGREANLPDMADAFIQLYREKNNISSAKVISASKLSEDKLNVVKQKINEFVKSDKIEITEVIDSSLLGGFILELGDKRYDASVKGKLNRLKKEFS